MCGGKTSDKDYKPLDRDWRGYLDQHPTPRPDYSGSYSPKGLQRLVEFAFTKGIDYSFLKEKRDYSASSKAYSLN